MNTNKRQLIVYDLDRYYNSACRRYPDDRVVGTYFYNNKFFNIVLPTKGMLCSFKTQVDGEDILSRTEYDARDVDIRAYNPDDLINIAENYISIIKNEYIDAAKNNCLSALILSHYFNEEKQETPQIEQFLEKTTEKEKTALRDIIERIGSEGYISLSSLIKITNISRPVYTSLLTKMKQFDIAKVTNLGVKGTKIEFLDLETLISEL